MSHGNEERQCCWCKQKMHISAKALSWHQNRCEQNPNPTPLPPKKDLPKWTCPGCGKVITEARKKTHRCPAPKLPAIRQGKFNSALELMNANDRRAAKVKQTTTCSRCHQTPCATPDACGRWIRANAQHAARLAREAAELGRKAYE